MLLTYNVDNLDLSLFKKHFNHYLSNIDSLNLDKLEFHLIIGEFKLIIKVMISFIPNSNECWLMLHERGGIIVPRIDSRLCNLRIINCLFPWAHEFGKISLQKLEITIDELCKLVNVISKLNNLKSFW